ncbi:MAG: T9SS type A sorting domain-containing protein [Bacteroidetes bacterium]|nr:T9SS type A sorting domain-containing protein [Bacteroidota bacterium]
MRPLLLFAALAVIALMLATPGTAQIKIDGLFFDWPSSAQLDVAPNLEEKIFADGDDTEPLRGSTDPGYFIDLDIDDVFALDGGDWVYFRVKFNPGANVMNIESDTTYHGGAAIAVYISVDPGAGDTTGLTWGWWGSGYDYFVQVYPADTAFVAKAGYPQPLWEHKQSGTGWDYEMADTVRGCLVAWNAANNEVELAVPKALLFHPRYLSGFVPPDSIAVMLYAGENLSPWRADYASNAGISGFKVAINQARPIAVDGLFFDWTPAMQLDIAPQTEEKTFADGDDTDPVRGGTDPAYFADMDIEDVYGTADDDFVYVRVKMAQGANVGNIATDTTYHGGGAIAVYLSVDPGPGDTTGLTWGWWGSGYDFFVQAFPSDSTMEALSFFPQPLWEHKQAGTGWDYEVADIFQGVQVAWNGANNDVEFAIPRSLLENPRYLPNFTPHDSIAIMIYAGENLSPWRADYASNAGISGLMLSLGTVTSVQPDLEAVPSAYVLDQNYPNPFNPSTTIRFAVPTDGRVRLRVFSVLGQEVATLVDGVVNAGWHTATFAGRDLTSGVYFYRLEVDGRQLTQKMMLVK